MSDSAISKFDRYAREYEAKRRIFVPCFDDFYAAIIAALDYADRPVARVLELGCGTGILSRRLRAALPQSELLLTDGAQAMIEQVTGTVTGTVTYSVLDFRDRLPAGPFDAIVSSMAIHHLDHDGQRDLYARVAQRLAPGGVFVNGEIVFGAGERTTAAYHAWHELKVRAAGGSDSDWNSYLDRREVDLCGSVADLLRWLEEAGLKEADCLFKQRLFAVVSAIAPS